MNFENILLEKKNSIAYVTVNRPKVLNALNMATMDELRAAFHDIKNDKSMRVVIFTGAGEKAFIAGADISELAKHDAAGQRECEAGTTGSEAGNYSGLRRDAAAAAARGQGARDADGVGG